MSVAVFVQLFETVGIPVLTATAAGYALWWLLKWITTSFKANLEDQYREINEEIRDIVKEALQEYFKSLHKELYYFCNKVKVIGKHI